MSLARFRAQNHPQQVERRGARPLIDDRATTPEFFAVLHHRFRFTIDAAASAANAKLPRCFTELEDGLAQSWAGERVFCNPPYSSIEPWVKKAASEERCPLVVMLLPANRTEQGWWQRLVEPARDRGGVLRVEFIAGRLRFIRPGSDGVGPNERPPFGICLLIWDREKAIARESDAIAAKPRSSLA